MSKNDKRLAFNTYLCCVIKSVIFHKKENEGAEYKSVYDIDKHGYTESYEIDEALNFVEDFKFNSNDFIELIAKFSCEAGYVIENFSSEKKSYDIYFFCDLSKKMRYDLEFSLDTITVKTFLDHVMTIEEEVI